MGALNEYIRMGIKGAKNLPNVVQGNWNLLKDNLGLLPEDQKQEAERRFLICQSCPFNSVNSAKSGFYHTERSELHCSVCKCPVEAKVMAMNDKCGLSLIVDINNDHGNQYIDGYKILWESYDTSKR